MNSPNRRKACEVQIERQAYLRHINRLQELKNGRSAQQLRRNYEQKKLAHTLSTVRKMHVCNREYKQKQMKQLEQESKGTDFNKVKSVVMNDFNWPIPIIAPKHKRNPRPILHQNLKIFERIIKAKTKVSALNEAYTQRKKKTPLPYISSSDFSKLYETSRVYEKAKKTLKLKLGKVKNSYRATLQLDFAEVFDFVRDLDSIYILEARFEDLQTKSESFILGQLQKMKISLKIEEKYVKSDGGTLKLRLIKILDNFQKKQLCKAKFQAEINKHTFTNQNKENSEFNDLNTHNYHNKTQSPRKILAKKVLTNGLPAKQKLNHKNDSKATIMMHLQKQSKVLQVNPLKIQDKYFLNEFNQ